MTLNSANYDKITPEAETYVDIFNQFFILQQFSSSEFKLVYCLDIANLKRPFQS